MAAWIQKTFLCHSSVLWLIILFHLIQAQNIAKEIIPIDANATAIVNNGQSVIIGGLVRNNTESNINKVPLLGDIPIFGNIFKHKTKSSDKATLVIVLTPYIIKKSEDLDKLRLTLARLNELEKRFIEDFIEKKSKNIRGKWWE